MDFTLKPLTMQQSTTQIQLDTKSPINIDKLNRQNKAVAEHLLSGQRIDRYKALKLYKIGNLHSRMSEVKKYFKDQGIEISKKFITIHDSFINENTTIMEYWLTEEDKVKIKEQL